MVLLVLLSSKVMTRQHSGASPGTWLFEVWANKLDPSYLPLIVSSWGVLHRKTEWVTWYWCRPSWWMMLMSKKGLMDSHTAGQALNKNMKAFLFNHEEVLVTGSSSPVLTPVHKGNTATFFFFRTTHTLVSNEPAEAKIISFPELDILDAGCVNTRSNNTGWQ